jgi:hypothetical protein
MSSLGLVLSWCPGQNPPAKCDPCGPKIPPNKVLEYLVATLIEQGVPSVAAYTPTYAYYHGESIDATITFTVQDVSIKVSGSTGPMYGWTQPTVFIPFSPAPVYLDPTQSFVVSGVSLPGWYVPYLPVVMSPGSF